MGITDKIKDIEAEMARTQKNKATEHHLGLLKCKLAKLRSQLLEPSKGGGKGEGFEVSKAGDARVALIGFPSVGKSTALSVLTETESEAAAYAFTTLTCIPGVIHYDGSKIQLLDMPGIIEGAAQGKGRGRQVVAAAKTADLVLMMLDATKGDVERCVVDKNSTYPSNAAVAVACTLEAELRAVGIRLNERPPNIYFKVKSGGGLGMNSTCGKLTHVDERLVRSILHEYKIFHAEVLFREDATVDQFIDVVEGNRSYLPCLYCYNKVDQVTLEMVEELARKKDSVVISAHKEWNLDLLVDKIWEYLNLVRVYTKRRGEFPSLEEPLILRRGATVEDVCDGIHKDFKQQFRYALVWGLSAKHQPQRVGLSHHLEDNDVIQLIKK